MKYTLRILASPFFFMVIFIWVVFHAVNRTILFIRYGGELINYEKDEKKTIQDIYEKLKPC